MLSPTGCESFPHFGKEQITRRKRPTQTKFW